MHPVQAVRISRPSPRRMPYQPGLDGLRALAIAAVLVYHAAPAALPGRVSRRRGLLRPEWVPDHRAAVGRMAAAAHAGSGQLLATTRAAAGARSRAGPAGDAGLDGRVPPRRAGQPARRPAGRERVCGQLARDRRPAPVLRNARTPTLAPAPVVSGRGRAVLPRVAAALAGGSAPLATSNAVECAAGWRGGVEPGHGRAGRVLVDRRMAADAHVRRAPGGRHLARRPSISPRPAWWRRSSTRGRASWRGS